MTDTPVAEDPAFSHCRVCGRLLWDPDSVRRGIGPECEEREAEPRDLGPLFKEGG